MVSLSQGIKYGIGGAFLATAARYVATTNPVTLVALAALPLAARYLSYCCSREQEPEIRVALRRPAAPVVQPADSDDDDKDLELAFFRSKEDQELQAALEQSSQEHDLLKRLRADLELEEGQLREELGLDEKEFDPGDQMAMAIAASQDPSEKVCVCPYAQSLLGGGARVDEDAIIPQSLLFEKSNGQKCNFATYMLSLLSIAKVPNEEDAHDILGLPVNQVDLEQMANCLGIDFDGYLNIWGIADSLHDNVNTKREGRFAVFKEMVEKGRNQEAIQYYQNHHPDVWE